MEHLLEWKELGSNVCLDSHIFTFGLFQFCENILLTAAGLLPLHHLLHFLHLTFKQRKTCTENNTRSIIQPIKTFYILWSFCQFFFTSFWFHLSTLYIHTYFFTLFWLGFSSFWGLFYIVCWLLVFFYICFNSFCGNFVSFWWHFTCFC